MPSNYDFLVRLAKQNGVSQEWANLDTLVDWRRRRIVTPETEVCSDHYTSGMWMRLEHLNLDDCVRRQHAAVDKRPPEVQGRTRFCVHCGSQLADAARFCGSCGTAGAPLQVRQSPYVAAPSVQASGRVDRQGEESRKKAQKYIVTGAVMLACGLCLAFIGNAVADQAASQARWSLQVSSDIQANFRLGKAMLGGGIVLALSGMATVIIGFAHKQ